MIPAGMTRDRERLAFAKGLGADSTIDVEQQDLRSTVMKLTGGYGVDVVVDTTGDPTGDIPAHAIALAAKGAYLSLNGLSQTVSVGDIKKNICRYALRAVTVTHQLNWSCAKSMRIAGRSIRYVLTSFP